VDVGVDTLPDHYGYTHGLILLYIFNQFRLTAKESVPPAPTTQTPFLKAMRTSHRGHI